MKYLLTIFVVFSILNLVVPKAQKDLKEMDRRPSNIVTEFIASN